MVQDAVAFQAFEFRLVKIIERLLLLAEEEPVLPLRAGDLALLKIGAEWRHARAGADHDDRRIPILRQAEMFRGMDEHARRVLSPPQRSARKVDATPLRAPAMALVAHRRHREMHGFRIRLETGSDGVKARLELAQRLRELLRTSI